MPKKISRDKAIARGLDKYFTGEPCSNGHIDKRYVRSQACLECQRGGTRRYKKTAKGKARDRRYGKSVKGKKSHKRAWDRYYGTPKQKAATKRYFTSPKGRDYFWRYARTPKGREIQRRQNQSPKGRERAWRFRNNSDPEHHERCKAKWRQEYRGRDRNAINATTRRRHLARVSAEYIDNPTQHNYNRMMTCRG